MAEKNPHYFKIFVKYKIVHAQKKYFLDYKSWWVQKLEGTQLHLSNKVYIQYTADFRPPPQPDEERPLFHFQ